VDPILNLIKFALDVKYEDLPVTVVNMVKNSVIDTLAVAVAGSGYPGIRMLVDLSKDWGGKKESSILVHGGKVPAPIAALVNCSMARACDFDSVHENGGGHLSATSVPTAFAFVEYSETAVSGKDFILINAICSEINCRLRQASAPPRGWLVETIAPLGVAAMGGRLLGFDEKQMLNALGVAYAQCCGNGQAMLDGAMTHSLQQGLGAKAGIFSVLLAKKGFKGAKNILQGNYGLFPLYMNGQYNDKVLLGNLGKHFEFVNTSIKPYPCCRMTHIPIYSTIEMLRVHDIKPEDIEEIRVGTNSFAYNLCANGDEKYNIKTPQDAQFSLPYTVSLAALGKDIFFEAFTDKAIKDPDVLSFGKKVKVFLDPEKDKVNPFVCPADMEIITKAGKHYSSQVEFIKGHPRMPFTFEECADKYRNCCRYSAEPIPEENMEKVIELAGDLDNLDNVVDIFEALCMNS